MEGWLELSHPFFFVSVGIADTAAAADVVVDDTRRGHEPRDEGVVCARRENKKI